MKLIIEDDEGRKTVVPFVREEITIGRQEGNTIRLTERNVSRKHARLLRQNGHVLVEDLGSYNGIRLNGEKITGQTQVHTGDLIQIGDYDLAIQSESAQTEGATPLPSPAPRAPTRDESEPTLRTPSRPAAEPAGAHAAHPSELAPPASPSTSGGVPEDLLRTGEIPPPEPYVEPDAEPYGDADARPHAPQDDESGEVLDPLPAQSDRDAKGRRQSTAVIRLDQLEAERSQRGHGQVLTLEAEEAPRLFVLNTDLQGREFACIRTELRVGRTEDNDIALDHRSLSRTHCKIVRDASGEWRVVDLQSANGLKVNGEPYGESGLHSGDVLELGHVKLKFLAPGEPFRFVPGAYDHGNPKPRWVLPVVLLLIVAALGGLGLRYRAKLGAALAALSDEHPAEPQPAPEPAHPSEPPAHPEEATAPAPTGTGTAQTGTANPPSTPDAAAHPGPGPQEAPPAVQMARVDEKLKAAAEAMSAREFEKAADILESAQAADGSRPKEADALLVRARAELAAKKNLAAAQRELAAGNMDQAAALLNQVQGSSAYAHEYEALRAKLDDGRALSTAPKSNRDRKSPPKVAAAVKPPPPSEEANSYYEDGTALFKKKQYREAQTLFTRCLEVDARFARCHMMLGSTDAKLRDVESGAKHYRMFVKLAPDDPEAPRVRALLEQYDKSRSP